MGCGCNKKRAGATASPGVTVSSGTGDYVLRMPNGTKLYYATEFEARQANRKMGNKGLVRRA